MEEKLQQLVYRPTRSIIKQLRDITKLSQAEIGKSMGYTQSYVSLLELRKRKILISTANALIKLARKLDIIIELDDLAKDYLLFDKHK
jgi:transcriptional regulator with XRE-family HTH domain